MKSKRREKETPAAGVHADRSSILTLIARLGYFFFRFGPRISDIPKKSVHDLGPSSVWALGRRPSCLGPGPGLLGGTTTLPKDERAGSRAGDRENASGRDRQADRGDCAKGASDGGANRRRLDLPLPSSPLLRLVVLPSSLGPRRAGQRWVLVTSTQATPG